MKSVQLGQLLAMSIVAALMLGCNTARITQSKIMTSAPAPRPSIIYVARFDLAPNCTLAASKNRSPKLSDRELAELQEVMAQCLVENLEKAGYQAARLNEGAPTPSAGWLIRGRFVLIDKGNLRKRALVGFGAGRENVRVICTVERLSESHGEALYELQTEAATRKLPGSILTPVPMLIGIRFAEEEDSLAKDVEKTAARITAEIRLHLKGAAPEVAELKISSTRLSAVR